MDDELKELITEVDWKELVAPPVEWDVRLALDLDRPNANNRTYSSEVWKKAVTEAQERIKNGTMLVYSGEPTLQNAVAMVTEVVTGNDAACAAVKFLPTDKGKRFEALIKAGYVNFFTSGVGSVKDGMVQDDYQLEYLSVSARPDQEPVLNP